MLKSLHNKIRMPIFAIELKSEMVLQWLGHKHIWAYWFDRDTHQFTFYYREMFRLLMACHPICG